VETINKGFDIQKKSLQRKNPSPLISATEKSTIQMAQSGMETEFSAEKLPLVIDSFQDDVQLLLSIDEVKRIYQSGQKEVARAELLKIFSDPNDEKIIHLARTHSRFDPEWNPVNRIYDFRYGRNGMAEKLALETIKTNPASESASQAAAMAFIASGKHEKALPILEVLSFSESKDVNLLRILADCYDKNRRCKFIS
jgi:predicted Zn-dependent protease